MQTLFISQEYFRSLLHIRDENNTHLIVKKVVHIDYIFAKISVSWQGSTFPGAQGHMPLDFAVGP